MSFKKHYFHILPLISKDFHKIYFVTIDCDCLFVAIRDSIYGYSLKEYYMLKNITSDLLNYNISPDDICKNAFELFEN